MQAASMELSWDEAMRRGDFSLAWKIGDAVLHAHDPALKHQGERHHQRIWHGESLVGQRVLVRCYHGLGDTLQFIRFMPALRQLARQVILWMQPELMPLIAQVPGIDLALPLHDGTPDAAYDVDIEIMELAHALRADATMISASVPYLHADARPHRPDDRRRIGLVWAAGGWDARRNLPAELFSILSNQADVELYSLQQGAVRLQAARIPAIDRAVSDIGELASLIRSLDLILTVDTMVAHLAGALGHPVWTILPFDCDWRWPRAGRSSVWYPSMRLFRQPSPGDWPSVVAEIVAELRSQPNLLR